VHITLDKTYSLLIIKINKQMKYFLTILLLLPIILNAQIRISLESGSVTTGYNDVRVPNGDQNAGTLFSFTDDFESDESVIFFRGELAYTINNKHTLEATAVPLTRNYNINTDREINFAGNSFQGEGITGSYQFNTYRFSYRYRLVNRAKFKFDLGASLLVRDARIALTQSGLTSDDTDLGYVPLVSFELDYAPTEKLSILLKGDALVGPVGRAEDVFAGILYDVYKDRLQLKAGYRIIEGGADVDQVYNFALFHFVDVGVVFRL